MCIERELREIKKQEKKLLSDMAKSAKKGYTEYVRQVAVTVAKGRKQKQALSLMIEQVSIGPWSLFLLLRAMSSAWKCSNGAKNNACTTKSI